MINALNASWANTAVDVVAFVIILAFCVSAGKKGFVGCLFSLISTVVAIILAFALMKPVLGWTNGLFGLQGWLEETIVGGLSKVVGFDVDVSAVGIEAALAEINLPAFLINIIADVGVEGVEQNTTLAMIVGEKLGALAVSLIAWLAVFALTKLILKAVQGVLTSLIEHIPVVGAMNHILGFIVGFLQGLLIVCGVIAVLALIPAEGMVGFFNECSFVGWLYNNNPINTIIGWIIH